METESARSRLLIRKLLAWYDLHRRVLPWRAPPGARPDPYRVLLSEIMLQQTTAATARGRFEAFIGRFPTVQALAAAGQDEILHAWQGLGYYRRARALHACARGIVEHHGGRVPAEAAALAALPGIGPYTAAAVRAIAFDQPDVPVDGNVQRVLARLFAIEAPLPAAAGRLRTLAATLAGKERVGDVAQALMDLGATVCRPRRPACDVCPWQDACKAHRAGVAEQLPRRTPRARRPVRRGLAFLLARPDGAILFRRRAEHGLLGGLHELPSSPWREGPIELRAALCHAPQTLDWRMHDGMVRHVFTHFVLELDLAEARTEAPPEGLWCAPDRLHELALPTVVKKLLALAGRAGGDASTFSSGDKGPFRFT
jgi:A/G-specific adenine glycosylase